MQKQKYTKEIIMALTGFTLWTISDSCIRYLNSYPTILVAFFGAFFCVILLLVLSPFLGGLKATFTMPQLKLRIFRGAVLSCSSSDILHTGIIIFYAFAVTFGSLFASKAYADAPTSVIAPIQYVQMLSGIILGAVLFAEYPDIWTLTGGGIIIAAGLLLIKFTRSV